MDSTNIKLKVAGLVNDSITDGPGFRFTVFVQGCPHHCEGCHNPQTWPFESGEDVDIEEIYQKIKSNPLIKGVTFSGGEPFCQPQALTALAKKLKIDGYELAIYTGFLFEELVSDKTDPKYTLLECADILVDGRFVQNRRNIDLRFRGSDNQRIIDVPMSIKVGNVVECNQERWVGIK